MTTVYCIKCESSYILEDHAHLVDESVDIADMMCLICGNWDSLIEVDDEDLE